MKSKEIISQRKPRNFVAKYQKVAGAGVHKNKKKAAKQGDQKHKGRLFNVWAEIRNMPQINTNETI